MDWRELAVVREARDLTRLMWERGWDEDRGGNLSCLLTEQEVLELGWCPEGVGAAGLIPEGGLRTIQVPDVPRALRGRLLLVTAAGSHFREVRDRPEELLGIVAIPAVGSELAVVAGLRGCEPTSELASHLAVQAVRLESDPDQRVVVHSHPTNVLALTHAGPGTAKELTRALWRVATEAVMLFPDGIGLVPWCVCGTEQIAEATLGQMRDRHAVVWQYHGMLTCGDSLRGAFGLMEAVDKYAGVWLTVQACGRSQPGIDDAGLWKVCDRFGLTPRAGYLEPR